MLMVAPVSQVAIAHSKKILKFVAGSRGQRTGETSLSGGFPALCYAESPIGKSTRRETGLKASYYRGLMISLCPNLSGDSYIAKW